MMMEQYWLSPNKLLDRFEALLKRKFLKIIQWNFLTD